MPGLPPIPAIYDQIALFSCPPTYSRTVSTLSSLCLTSKFLHRIAEPHLYTHLMFFDPHHTNLACQTILRRPQLGLHVRTFCHHPEPRRFPHLPQAFWLLISKVLCCMKNLDCLMLSDDATFSHTWVLLAPPDSGCDGLPSQIRDIKLKMAWDNNVLKFIQHQSKVNQFRVYSPFDDANALTPLLDPPLVPLSLQVFDGYFPAIWYFCQCPLTHAQIVVPSIPPGPLPGDTLLPLFQRLASAHKTLRSLSLLDLPPTVAPDVVNAAAQYLPALRHLGVLALPIRDRHTFLRPLMYLHDLTSIELDLSSWSTYVAAASRTTAHAFSPAYTPMYHPSSAALRALACELKTFCPTLVSVSLWVGPDATTRVRWLYDLANNTWHNQVVEGGNGAGLNPTSSGLWRSMGAINSVSNR
ncbi:hypothetical protein BDN72DRAFT_841785 [Pluteus cervinus]|uniref:Uncharacterized protein n=1 Tax=Pluteus cervinus TaxID=181527 RepID=A0ACD3AS94_9AGAR|nr:hypothetical protein BDN72DRAFT_841785 [Pluteus cervinus]